MLKDKSSSAIVAVHDIARAKGFYGDTLGLELLDDSPDGVLVFRTGDTSLVVYRSESAGTNRANAVVWAVGDEIESIAATLKGRGVKFERYPDMGMQLDGDVYVAGPMKLLWFKDPDGNILHLNSM